MAPGQHRGLPGAQLELVTERFEDTAIGPFILAVRAFNAEIERQKIAERIMRSRVEPARQEICPNVLFSHHGQRADTSSAFLYSLVAAGLLEVVDERFSNVPESQKFLVRGSPDYLGGRRVFFARRWNSLFKTSETIKTGIPQGKLDYSTVTAQQLESYFPSIYNQTVASANNLLARYDFSSHRHLADVGGGSGGLAITIAKACPGLKATVIDQPNVIPFTQKFIDEAGANEEIEALAADAVEGTLSGTATGAGLTERAPAP